MRLGWVSLTTFASAHSPWNPHKWRKRKDQMTKRASADHRAIWVVTFEEIKLEVAEAASLSADPKGECGAFALAGEPRVGGQ